VGQAEGLRLALERAQREKQGLEDENVRLRQEAAATAAQLERLRQLHSAAADGPPRARGAPAAAAAAAGPPPRPRASGGSSAVELAALAASLLPRGHRAKDTVDALLSAVQGDAAKSRLMQAQQAQLLQLVGGQPGRGF